MPEYLHPGVYIEETSFRGKPIQGVGTSTAGFVGAARKGPEGRATFIPSFAAFKREFGDPIASPGGLGDYLGHAVKSFFDNGGPRCYVVRTLAADALASEIAIEQGISLRLAPGVTVRGPTRTVRLNALRGVGVGTVLRFFTRPDANSPFAETRTGTVESYDPMRNSVTLVAADEIPSGVALEANHTAVLIQGMAPANAVTIGGGATFTARNRGVDGDAIAVQIRPRDSSPIALTSVGMARQDPLIDVAAGSFPLSVGDTDIEFTQAALQRMRVGDEISIGGSTGLTINAIADGSVTFDDGGAAVDHSAGGATISLISRGGAALDTPVPLGAAPANMAIDMTAGGPVFGPAALPHDLAMLLRANDVVQIDTGGVTSDLTITAVSVAPAGANNVTLDAPGMTTDEAGPAEARVTTTAAGAEMSRIYVGDASGLSAPQRAGAPESLAVTDGTNIDTGNVLLVDLANNAIWMETGAALFPDQVGLDTWVSAEMLQVAGDGQATVRVATTSGIYSGAKVEVDTGTAKIERIVQSVDVGVRTVTFTAGLPLGAGNSIDLPADPADRNVYIRVCEIDVLVYENGVLAETFDGLTWNADPASDASLRYYAARINDDEVGSDLVRVVPAAAPGLGFDRAPSNADGQPKSLAGGSNGSALTALDLIGEDNGPGQRTGIQALGERDDIAIVAVPGVTAETVQGALLTHCERLKYRIAVLDAPADALDVVEMQSHRQNYDSLYGAYYGPWLKALNPENGRIENFPPSGYVAGIYGRSDANVGVHKAPANEVVRNITDVALPFSAAEQDVLNPIGVNLIRDLTPRGIRVWGARTTTSDQEWKYVNIRRLFIFLEHSIDLGTQWVVFEPNSEVLWAKVIETVSSFLTGVWKTGALHGATPEQAFFVTCDRTTMTQDDIDNGRLICEIGVAPVAPAEFVIFRIGQATLTE